MALKAVFVGVNRYLDPAIPELCGARRDAMALWALFTDTIEGLASRRLIDEEATHSEVSDAILGTLEGAQEDDVIVITFAGHGSPDGRLLLSDTDATNLPGTALPMTALADAFKGTSARTVLCILDCCFSGQAPARVFETEARPRNAFALDGVAGEGRILLAACATSESAWEQPGTGHGLLTHATIEALSKENGETVSFPEVAGEIVRLTRVEAERIGVTTQTPVFLGSALGSDGVGLVLNGRYDLGFFTFEIFLNMALRSPHLLNQVGLVVLDEGQFITDPSRGITVELIFSLLLKARERGIQPQLLVLSAVIGSLNNFDRWLGLPVLFSRDRPVPLVEGVLDRRGTLQFVDVDGMSKSETLLPEHHIVQRRQKASSQDVIVPLARTLVATGEKLLVFRNTRGPAQGCAGYLSRELGLGPAAAVIEALPTQDLTSVSQLLRECLLGGTAFHNTNLLRAEREAVEKGYRNPDGGIHVLAATTTLAAGINTPASTVILAEKQFVGEDGRPFTIAEYKNMAGRAGRLGYNEIGKAIILADTPIERAQLFQKYVLGTPEEVTSSFQQRDLPTWTLRLLSQVPGVPQDQIPSLLSTLFPDQPTFLTGMDQLLNRLEFGLPADALPLMRIPLALTRGQYLALFASGCTTAGEATTLPVETLTDCIGADEAALLTAG